MQFGSTLFTEAGIDGEILSACHNDLLDNHFNVALLMHNSLSHFRSAVYSRTSEKMQEDQIEAILAHVCQDEAVKHLVKAAGGLKATKTKQT